MEPVVPLQLAVPDSKPGFSSFWPEQVPVGGVVVGPPVVGGGVVPPVQVGSPDCAGTETASHAALTVLNWVQLPGNRFLAAVSVQVRYFRYDDDEVFISIALYMTLIAFWMPSGFDTVEPLRVGLAGWPLPAEPCAIR